MHAAHDIGNTERVVGWVQDLAQGFGVPDPAVHSLVAGVCGALGALDSDGIVVDRIAMRREYNVVEIQLIGSDRHVGTFLWAA